MASTRSPRGIGSLLREPFDAYRSSDARARRSVVYQFAAILLALGAIYLSSMLLAKHVRGDTGPSWFDAGCHATGTETGGCATVLNSPYSYAPPRFPNSPPGTRHVPVAYLGLLYYCLVLVWLIGVGRPSPARWMLHVPIVLIVAYGVFFHSVRYTYIMFTRIDDWCPWCLVTHGLNLGLFILLLMMWPRAGGRTQPGPAEGAEGDVPAAAPRAGSVFTPRPTWRQLVATLLAMVLVYFWLNEGLRTESYAQVAKSNKASVDKCAATLNKVKATPGAMLQVWRTSPKQDVPLRPDDPHRTAGQPGDPMFRVVVFSDFGCPACKTFADNFEKAFARYFDGRIILVFKHYPIDRSCNERVSQSLHPNACEAARWSEAARIAGGGEAFWKLHDFLFANQSRVRAGSIEPAELAAAAGVEAGAFLEALKSEEIAGRILEDIETAGQLKVTSTPWVMVNGQYVEWIARTSPAFWNDLANIYWHQIAQERPAHTYPQRAPAGTSEEEAE